MKLFEIDLYKFHSNPETLHGHDRADEIVPERIYNIAKSRKKLTDKQEDVLAKNSEYAYRYAQYILKKPWSKGEDVIAKDAEYAYYYAHDVLKMPWPKGEATIAKDSQYAYYYALNVLKKPWPKGEDSIAKDTEYAYEYARNILKLTKAKAKMWHEDKYKQTQRK